MKWLYKISLFVFVASFFFACTKQTLPPKPKASPFTVTAASSAAVAEAGGQLKVNVKTFTDGWWVVIPPASADWCSSSRTYGSGDATVTFTLKANTTGASRSVEVQFNPTFDLPVQTITIKQQ